MDVYNITCYNNNELRDRDPRGEDKRIADWNCPLFSLFERSLYE